MMKSIDKSKEELLIEVKRLQARVAELEGELSEKHAPPALKKVEEALRDSERRLADAERIGHIGSWEWNIKSGEVHWSEEMYHIRGQDPHTYVPSIDLLLNQVHPDDRVSFRKVMDQVLSDGKRFSIDFRIILPDGLVRLHRSEGETVEFDESSRPVRVIGTVQDVTERKQWEKTLQKNEKSYRNQAARLQAILDATPAVIWIAHDRECKVITGNRAAAILSRVPEGENMSKSGPAAERLLHYHIMKDGMELRPEEMPLQRVSASGKELLNYSLDFVHDDGTTYPLMGNIIPVLDSNGNPNGAIAAFLDITELKRTEEALRRKERTLAEAQRIGHIGSWEWNVKTGETGWSEELYHIFGQDPSTYVPSQQSNLELIHPEDREIVQRMSDLIRLDGLQFSMEYRIIHPSGSVRTLQSEGIVTDVDEAGKPRRMVGMIQDITDRKEVQEALKKARDGAENEKRRLEALMEALPVGVAITDEHGGNIGGNAAFDKIWRGTLRRNGPRTRSIRDYTVYQAWWPETGRPVQPEEWGSARAVQKGETVVGQFIEIRRFDGTQAFIMNSAAPIFDGDGKVIGSAVAIQDVTELKRIQDDLRDSETKYRQLSKVLKKTVKEQVEQLRQAESLAAIGRMVAIVAHEIRNPLLNILLGADSLRKAMAEDDERAQIFEEIEHGVNLLNDTVEELLEYARPVRLNYSSQPLGGIITRAVKALPQKDNIILDLELDNEEEEMVIDSNKIIRALINILLNAIDAMPAGGTLKIRSKLSSSRRLSLFISDSGYGMDAGTLKQLFEPFYTNKTYGTGLGLAISKKIIEAHNGNIAIRSKPAKGTTVTVTLPTSSIK